MADVVIAQRDYFIEGAKPSPAVYKDLGRFENITFYGTITLVEGSGDDGATWSDITSSGTASPGVIFFKGVSFKWYRVSGTGDISASAN